MLTVFDCWTSYIHWGKVHNFFIICISPLIRSGYDPFCQDSHMPMFFITSDFFTSAISHWEKWFEYIFGWCAELKWSWLSEPSHPDFQSLKGRRHRFLAAPLVSPPPSPFFVPWFLFMVKEKCKKKDTTVKEQGRNISSSQEVRMYL